MSQEHRPDEGTMPFLEHLEELRWRIIKSLAAILICGSGVYVFREKAFQFALDFPLRLMNPKPEIIATAPSEAFLVSIKVAFFGGLFIAFPFVLFQIWRFVAPALFRHERRYTLIVVVLSVICFAVGIAFSLYVTPQVLRILGKFGTSSIVPKFTVDSFLGFVVKLTLAFGLVFQLPAASLVLSRAGVITYKSLLRMWRVALVVIFVISAFITPPDIISQTMMAVPLFVLYLASIGIARLAGKRQKTTT